MRRLERLCFSDISLGRRIPGHVLEKYENKIKVSNQPFIEQVQCTLRPRFNHRFPGFAFVVSCLQNSYKGGALEAKG